jgi:hypothetical protein
MKRHIPGTGTDREPRGAADMPFDLLILARDGWYLSSNGYQPSVKF